MLAEEFANKAKIEERRRNKIYQWLAHYDYEDIRAQLVSELNRGERVYHTVIDDDVATWIKKFLEADGFKVTSFPSLTAGKDGIKWRTRMTIRW